MSRHSTENTNTLIGLMRESNWTMRSIASVVILTFGGLVTSPAVAAVKQEIQQVQQQKAAEGPGSRFSANMKSIKEHLAATLKTPKGTSLADMKRQLNTDTVVLAASDREMLDGFDSVRTMIKDKHLPDVIMQRELAAEKHYNIEMSALKQGLTAIVTENDDAKAQAKSKDVLDRLSQFQDERKAQKFDPKNLPNRSLKPDLSRKPHKTKKEFAEAGFISNPRLMVATTAPNFDYSQLPGANDPAYLAATTEVTLSPAIQAQAAALNYNPVQIYNWVRNNVQWQPTWGAVQDADLTLSAQRGNAFDISSLLIALLRASNIPARYVHGTIDVPEAKFRNWVGGFQDINAAVNYASAGGIPVTSLVSGGKITTIQMEHIWVEAAIDYIPSLGAVNKSADTWVPMDASYKQFTKLNGVNLASVSGVDTQIISNSFVASGTTNSQEGWVSGVNETIVQNAETQFANSIQNYISQNLPNATWGDIVGGNAIVTSNQNSLSPSLQTAITTVGARYATLPTSLEQHISFSLGVDAQGNPENSIEFPWSQLNNQQVILSFRPATSADQQAFQALLPAGPITDVSQLPTSIPSYLIEVIPELKVNSIEVSSGSPIELGTDISFQFTAEFAGGRTVPNEYSVVAGSYLDVGVIAGSVDPQALSNLQAEIQQTQNILQAQDQGNLSSLNRENVFGNIFEAGLLNYYAQYSGLAYVAGLQAAGHMYLAGGLGTFGYEPNVDYSFGIPRDVHGSSVVLNVPIVNVLQEDTSDQSKAADFALHIGLISSALESTVPEELFSTAGQSTTAVSAVEALSQAAAAGQRIYCITQANEASVVPLIHHSSLVMQEISDALSAGKEVITHTDDISVSGWTGAGYILFDPSTGDGAYKISGGQNGGLILAIVGGLFVIGALALPGLGALAALLLVMGAAAFGLGIALHFAFNPKARFDPCIFLTVVAGIFGVVEFSAAAGIVGLLHRSLWFFGMLTSLGVGVDCL